ncbi:MAG TPA: MCP four helix bundle domain-containing protein, partial [Opitutales bacterium]|nr:MCP four helix bundle domain-containing protein [Opitutales bacterium]
MSSWTIGRRITFGFAVLTALSFIIGITAYLGLGSIGKVSNALVEDNMPSALLLGQIKDNLSRSYGNILNTIRLPAGSEVLKKEVQKIQDRIQENNVAWKEFEGRIYTDGDRKFFQEATNIRASYQAALAEMLKYAETDDVQASYNYLD